MLRPKRPTTLSNVSIRIRRLGCFFNQNSLQGRTLCSVGLSLRQKRVIVVAKPSNSNGAALLALVKTLHSTRRNDLGILKRRLINLNGHRLIRIHHGVNFVFRSRGLFTSLATSRGIRVTIRLANRLQSGHRQTTRVLTQMKLTSQISCGPTSLSKKRGRQITVTHTLIGRPRLVLTSRPATTLSGGSNHSIIAVVRRVTQRRGYAVLVIARSGQVLSITSHVVGLMSNHLRSSRDPRRFISTRTIGTLSNDVFIV